MKRLKFTTRATAIAARRIISRALGLPQPGIAIGGGRYDGVQASTTNHALFRRKATIVRDANGRVVSVTPQNVWTIRVDDVVARIRAKLPSDLDDSVTQTMRGRLTPAQRTAFDAAFDAAETVADNVDDEDDDDDGS